MDSLITTVSLSELNIKAFVDLIDEMAETFHYIPSEQLGYIGFSTKEQLEKFCERAFQIKDDIVILYSCWEL